MTNDYEAQHLSSWQERQEYAELMQPLVGRLFRNSGVEITVYGRPLVNASTIDIIKAHRMARQFEGEKLRLRESWPFVKCLSELKLTASRIDVGKLAYAYTYKSAGVDLSVEEYLRKELAAIIDVEDQQQPQDVVLYGFGRIGRILARLLIERHGSNNKLRLRAIVVRGGKDGDLEKRASLLRRDSVHGPFNGSITVDHQRSAIKANGSFIQVIYADSPEQVDYTQYGIEDAIVIDNTGKWRDKKGLSLHLQAKGTAKVLLTAPGKGDIPNIVHGVNQQDIAENTIVSAASCTTNAITPVLKALYEQYGIQSGHVETVHSYTNDQNLIDNYHNSDRRGRSAALNMVITETGAAKAVAKAFPQLQGKLTGNAIRVPTPNVSLAILNLYLDKETDKPSINQFLRDQALFSNLQNQIDYTASTELVSTDLVGSRYACVVDSQATIVDGNRATLYCWYDNEFGYSCQVMRVVKDMSHVNFPTLPV